MSTRERTRARTKKQVASIYSPVRGWVKPHTVIHTLNEIVGNYRAVFYTHGEVCVCVCGQSGLYNITKKYYNQSRTHLNVHDCGRFSLKGLPDYIS